MTRIFGTWDFKWPQTPRAEIRVAFQDLPSDFASAAPPLEQLIDMYLTTAELWRAGGANLQFVRVDQRLPAPAPKGSGQWNVRSELVPDHDEVGYDVLVSFAPMPAFVQGTNGQPLRITGQVSVLGSYAKRVAYGIPTTMVGPNLDYANGRAVTDYYQNPVFRHVILHEVAHVLGIAHAHQNPLLQGRDRLEFKDPADIEQVLAGIRSDYWTEFTPDEVHEEIAGIWPHEPNQVGPNPIAYSDWRPLAVAGSERLENKSVMAHPVWSDLLEVAPAQLDPLTRFLDRPGAWDLDMIGAMYPPR